MATKSNKQILGRFMICNGCRCTYKDDTPTPNAEISLQEFNRRWTKLELDTVFDLVLSGCFGQCQIGNLCGIVHSNGYLWLGRLKKKGEFENLLQWAEKCKKVNEMVAFPARLLSHRIE